MEVKITDYGQIDGENYIVYDVLELDANQLNFLNDNLNEETQILKDFLRIKMFFDDDLYPFQSDVAKIRLDDFIAREEIEMTVFLASFLEDM